MLLLNANARVKMQSFCSRMTKSMVEFEVQLPGFWVEKEFPLPELKLYQSLV